MVAAIVMLTTMAAVSFGLNFYKKIIKPLDMKMVNTKKEKFKADYSASDNRLVVELDNPVSGRFEDPLDIMEANGINFCRLELNNNPGKGRGDGKYYLPEGFQNQEDILKIAKRAKKHNFEIQLSFMLSDFWTYGIPEDFRKDIEGIKDEEYELKTQNFKLD